jgi:hypothetical protein
MLIKFRVDIGICAETAGLRGSNGTILFRVKIRHRVPFFGLDPNLCRL